MLNKINVEEAEVHEVIEYCDSIYYEQYGHNIVALVLQAVERKWGKETAQDIYERYN